MNIRNIASSILIIIAIIVALIFGKKLIIPFLFAVLFWFIVHEIRHFIDRSKYIESKFPTWLKNIATSLIIILFIGFISSIISSSINALSQSYKNYEQNVGILIKLINEAFGVEIYDVIKGHAADLNFGKILNAIINSISDILGNAFMILIYAIFIFLEEKNFKSKLGLLFKDKGQVEKVDQLLTNIKISISKYLGLKTMVSFLTGFLSYIALAIIGIDAPLFWALLIFLLNFIPTIGSLIATIFPMIFCLLQFGELSQGIMVLIFVGAIQILVGNIIEPKVMGNSMNISPLVTILSLSFWGAVWGITGMILSVPITVILIIIFAQFNSTKRAAILLSEKGKV